VKEVAASQSVLIYDKALPIVATTFVSVKLVTFEEKSRSFTRAISFQLGFLVGLY